MIATVWVAAGSALGGVARYGFGIIAARLWGSAFPWGTIAINVCGSFLISFFGTLTLAEGLLPASPNLRTFVMVGFCGGFTTFSSFSLQTLELARGGQWVGAAANVLLSVACCLLAVTLGHLGAARLSPGRSEAAIGAHIVAVLDRPQSARSVLAAAGLTARRLGETRLEALHVRDDPMEGFMPTEEVMTDQRRREIEGEDARRSAELREIFEQWRRETGLGSWRELTGEARRIVPEQARDADLLVIGRPGGEALHEALFDTDAAVLLVSDDVPSTLGRHVAIAFKPGKAVTRAVRAAGKLLQAADRVTVLTATGEGDAQSRGLPDELSAWGGGTRWHRFRPPGGSIGQAIIDEAGRLGADLVVMGAYSRGRLASSVFGGVTRDVLAGASLPVLMHR